MHPECNLVLPELQLQDFLETGKGTILLGIVPLAW